MAEGKVTMYTIAAKAGVSIAAVSRAFDPGSRLRPEKRELILGMAKQLGYVPNRMAARLSCRTVRIGVLIYGEFEAYYSELADGIRAAHRKLLDYKVDCDLRILDKSRDEPSAALAVIGDFIGSGCDGAVISGLWREETIPELDRLAAAGIPYCLLDSDLPSSRRTFVSMNDTAAAGRIAAELLGCAMSLRGLTGTRRAAVFVSDLANGSSAACSAHFPPKPRGTALRCVTSSRLTIRRSWRSSKREICSLPVALTASTSPLRTRSRCAAI